jgi:hypothetical protein
MGLRPFVCWDCGFESRGEYGRLSLLTVLCCHVEYSASGWSPVQRSPTECVACLSANVKFRQRGSPGQLGAVTPWKKKSKKKSHNYKSSQTTDTITECGDSHVTTYVWPLHWKLKLITEVSSFITDIHVHAAKLSICLSQIMQETLSFFMFLLQVKDKNEETKQVQWRREQNTKSQHTNACGSSFL